MLGKIIRRYHPSYNRRNDHRLFHNIEKMYMKLEKVVTQHIKPDIKEIGQFRKEADNHIDDAI